MTVEMWLSSAGIAVLAGGALLSALKIGSRQEACDRMVRSCAWGGILCVLAALVVRGVNEGRVPAFGRFEVLSCYAISIIIACLHAMSKGRRLMGIPPISLALVAAVVGFAMTGADQVVRAEVRGPGLSLNLHIITAFIGYGFFTFASILAASYMIQDHNLKKKRFGFIFERLPPLTTLDDLMHRQVAIAFPVFTIAIALGVRHVWLTGGGREWLTDPKIVATAVTWVVYAVLIHLRLRADQHGRKLAVVVLLGLLCVLFAFVGANALSSSVHDFVTGQAAGR